MPEVEYYRESFTPEEADILRRFFTNIDRPVFAVINLPEVVKGALFARYSRSAKSIRRLFLDEFVGDPETGIDDIARRLGDATVGLERAERLYRRVFHEFGDDSVAQLGGAHLACEQASNVLTKVLEWGRLAAYLEQSTRYIFYDTKLGGRHRYFVPAEVEETPLRDGYVRFMEDLFETYAELVADMKERYERAHPRAPEDPVSVWTATIRAKACDTVRGLLPAATLSNVGIYATGQAYEMALVRMRAHPLREVRDYADLMLVELRKVIPSFLTRVDVPDRGGAWSAYLADTARRLEEVAASIDEDPQPEAAGVTLTDWDPEAEVKLVAAALYSVTELPDARLTEIARAMSPAERARVLAALVGERGNRRHKPGRAMERPVYRFDVVCDFGAFRDLQRHRMLTLEWQRWSTRLGYDVPDHIVEAGHERRWRSMMERAGELYEEMRGSLGPTVAQYVVPFAYHVRFVMEMNAREAFHLLELRSQPAGHPAYRRIAQEMHRQIAEVAGHRAIAEAMRFVDYSAVALERLESERRAARRRAREGV